MAAASTNKFNKRVGTTDRGKEYEHLYMVHLLLKLSTNTDIKDFQLSSNDEEFGSFDDVVVEIDYGNNKTTTYAIQLKHKEAKTDLATGHLRTDKNFKIDKYLEDYEKNLKKRRKEKSLELILFTNKNWKSQSDPILKHKYNKEEFSSTIVTGTANPLFNTSENTKECLRFRSAKYKEFFDSLYLYTDQTNVDELEKSTLSEFQNKFVSSPSVFQELVLVITKWSLKIGEKKKIDKSFIQTTLAMLILSPHMKTLTFSDEANVNSNGKILTNAISQFHLTYLSSDKYEAVNCLWADALSVVDDENLKEIHDMYDSVLAEDIIEKEALIQRNEETNKLLWLTDKCPLIIEKCPELDKILNFAVFQTRHLIVLLSDEENVLTNINLTSFRNLSDLKKEQNERTYGEILSHFTYSLEGQKEVPLKKLLSENGSLATLISTDKLVQMVNGPLPIGKEESLPPCHISRSLTKILIDLQFLQATNNNNTVISDVGDVEVFRKKLRNTAVNGTKITFNNNNNQVFIVNSEYSQEEFKEWYSKDNHEEKHYHQFRYLERESCLEWIRSTCDVRDLQEFRCDHKYNCFTYESQLFGKNENNINIVCADSGMGKTTLAKSLKKNSSSDVWTLIIYAKNFKFKSGSNSVLESFIEKKYTDSIDKEVYNHLLKKNRIRIIWDGLDEVEDQTLKNILVLVNDFGTYGYKQWITSRKNLIERLEKDTKAFTRGIKEFTEEQQQNYFQERLGLSDDESVTLFKKIKTNMVFMRNDVLGIPLQIYMLTELFSKNLQKYLDLLEESSFTILNLYDFFVEEKFNIYFKEKLERNSEIDKNKVEMEQQQKEMISSYKRVAFNFYFKNNTSQLFRVIFCSSNGRDPFLENMKKGDGVGIISKVNDNKPQFSHNSYGEYFAALYLCEKDPKRTLNNSFISNEKFGNIRFFLDLMLSKSSLYHKAVLHKNCKILPQCTSIKRDDFTDSPHPFSLEASKDEIDRNVIQLACAWCKNYPYINKTALRKKEYKDATSSFLNANNTVRTFNKIQNSLHLCVKNLLVLMPFLIQYYNVSYQRFDEQDLHVVLYYAIKFDYAVIFACEEKIDWLHNIHTKLDAELLMSLIMHFNARDCLQELIEKKNYAHVLLSNFKFSSDTSSFVIFELFSILNQANDKLGNIQSIYSQRAQSDIQEMLAKCLEINARDAQDRMMIHYACEQGDYKTVKALLNKGSAVNVADVGGCLPIHLACERGHYDIVKMLIEYDDSVLNVEDKEGRTPIHKACKKGNRYIVELLLDKGVKVDTKDAQGKTPLNCIKQSDSYFDQIKEMIQKRLQSEIKEDV